MTEKEYIDATSLTKARVAILLLRDLSVFYPTIKRGAGDLAMLIEMLEKRVTTK